jgi:hypothetical protein
VGAPTIRDLSTAIPFALHRSGGRDMELEGHLRTLIQYKLRSGELPYYSASKVSGSPAAGEICAVCRTAIQDGQLMMEAVTGRRRGELIQLHVFCFELWNDERQQPHKQIA